MHFKGINLQSKLHQIRLSKHLHLILTHPVVKCLLYHSSHSTNILQHPLYKWNKNSYTVTQYYHIAMNSGYYFDHFVHAGMQKTSRENLVRFFGLLYGLRGILKTWCCKMIWNHAPLRRGRISSWLKWIFFLSPPLLDVLLLC